MSKVMLNRIRKIEKALTPEKTIVLQFEGQSEKEAVERHNQTLGTRHKLEHCKLLTLSYGGSKWGLVEGGAPRSGGVTKPAA